MRQQPTLAAGYNRDIAPRQCVRRGFGNDRHLAFEIFRFWRTDHAPDLGVRGYSLLRSVVRLSVCPSVRPKVFARLGYQNTSNAASHLQSTAGSRQR